ncbi:hypothetical protein ACFX2B_008572 [Malus domestica]
MTPGSCRIPSPGVVLRKRAREECGVNTLFSKVSGGSTGILKVSFKQALGGSIFLFDKKVHKHFRKDGHRWKKAKDGRIKKAHERLKVEGLDTLCCYYAHGEDQNFQRRSYSMLEENLSHMVLVHYWDVKGEKIKARYIEKTETTEGVQHFC